MLSDSLFDSIMEIEQYEQDYPEMYGYLKASLAQLKHHLDDVRQVLDTGSDAQPDWRRSPGSFRSTSKTEWRPTLAQAKRLPKLINLKD